MMRTPSVSLATVTFDVEYDLLRLQYRSLARHVEPGLFDAIYLLDNGRRPLGHRRVTELRHDLGPHGADLRVIHGPTLVGVDDAPGWIRQQALKLAVAHQIRSDFYLVLDAKNHVLRTIDTSDLFDRGGLPRTGRHSYVGHSLRAPLEAALALFDLDPGRYVPSFTPTHTPFLLETSRVRRMIVDLHRRTGRGLVDALATTGITEFSLYGAFVVHESGSLDSACSPVALSAEFIWPGRRSRADAASTIAQARAEHVAFFAVHRRALLRLDRHARHRLEQLWVSCSLVPSTWAARRLELSFALRFATKRVARRVRSALRREPRHAAS